MADYLLVIGASTDQSEPARLETLRKGLRPQVIHLTGWDVTLEHGLDEERFNADKALIVCIRGKYTRIPVTEIRAAVMNLALWADGHNLFSYFKDDLSDPDIWVVHPGGAVERV